MVLSEEMGVPVILGNHSIVIDPPVREFKGYDALNAFIKEKNALQ